MGSGAGWGCQAAVRWWLYCGRVGGSARPRSGDGWSGSVRGVGAVRWWLHRSQRDPGLGGGTQAVASRPTGSGVRPSGRADPGHDQVCHPAGELVGQRPVALQQPMVAPRRTAGRARRPRRCPRGSRRGRWPAGPGPCCWPGAARTPAPATPRPAPGRAGPRRPARPASGQPGCGSPTGSSLRSAASRSPRKVPVSGSGCCRRTRPGRRRAPARRGIPSGGRPWPCPPRPGRPPPPSTSRRGRARPAVRWPRPGWPGPPASLRGLPRRPARQAPGEECPTSLPAPRNTRAVHKVAAYNKETRRSVSKKVLSRAMILTGERTRPSPRSPALPGRPITARRSVGLAGLRPARPYASRLASASPSPRRRPRHRPRLHGPALALILTAAFMVVLDFSIVNVALPSIERRAALPGLRGAVDRDRRTRSPSAAC